MITAYLLITLYASVIPNVYTFNTAEQACASKYLSSYGDIITKVFKATYDKKTGRFVMGNEIKCGPCEVENK